jgi:predicted lipoprotein
MLLRLLLLALMMLGVAAATGQAQTAADQTYKRLVDSFIRPGFAELAVAAKRHEAAWADYCRSPSEEGLATLSTSFHALADRWAGIEMFRSGPAAQDFRLERFYFWPERRNAVDRGLAALLSGPEALNAQEIRKQSAAVQGLPALERLIHVEGQADPQLGVGKEGQRRCKAGEAIAANAAGLAAEMSAAWTAAPDEASAEARAMAATDIVTAYAILKDRKIEAVIGRDAAQVKPRAAEFWRSGRPMRNILLNLEALVRLNGLLFHDSPDDVSLPYATETALRVARPLADLAAAAGGERRRDALLLRDAVDAAEDRAVIEVPLALGVSIGFNSLDGD